MEEYVDAEDYNKQTVTRTEVTNYWDNNIGAADRVYKKWANRFLVNVLYSYYEGYQWADEADNRNYVVNMVYAHIDSKLPGLMIENPEFSLRPKPSGIEFNFEEAAIKTQAKEDVLNFVASRKQFGLNDIHELAIIDAFFGFGVIDVDISDIKQDNPLDKLDCKHIPFDRFRVSAQANWNLKEGKWWGYYEFIPYEDLEKYEDKLKFENKSLISDDDEAAQIAIAGKITVGESSDELIPNGYCKIWKIWDFKRMKFIKLCFEHASRGDRLLEYKDFKSCGISVLRYGKRRKGWYPLPPVFNWLSPQDEINDIRQTHKVHRKRYSRKYGVVNDGVESEELDKFLNGPDGTTFKMMRPDAIVPIIDAPLDTANQQSLVLSYDDFLRVAGGDTEQGRIGDRTTATQANINASLAKIRESKDMTRVANFLMETGNNILKGLKKVGNDFWALVGVDNEGIMKEVQTVRQVWKRIPAALFDEDDHDITVKVTSVSPVYQEEDKKGFMEFLAMITQYEILAFSPGLLREAAYRCGYKNETVLNQFMELAQLAAIGRQAQLKGQIQQVAAPTGSEPGQLAQQQMDKSAPPDLQEISNLIFNKQGVQ